MATVSQLSSMILDTVQDSSFSDDILLLLNGALADVSTQVPIPDLSATATVETSTTVPYVSLPTDYGHHLHFVSSTAQGRRIRSLHLNISGLLRLFPVLTNSGAIEAVAVDAGRLYYQPIPTAADTLTLWYYKVPTSLVNFDDEPSEIPSQFHVPLLCNYAIAEIYNKIFEGGQDNAKSDYITYSNRYKAAVESLFDYFNRDDDVLTTRWRRQRALAKQPGQVIVQGQ